MENRAEVIGFLGLGPMGCGIASNIIRKGRQGVVIAHRNRAAINQLTALGATEVSTLAELGQQADTILLCLPSSKEVERSLMGPAGLLGAMRAGQLIIECSTSSPVSTMRLGKELAARGIDIVDAPLTRTPKEAEAGRLNVILGGEPGAIARARPVIDLFAENVFLSGPLGSAHKLKLINNFMSIGCSLVVAEAVLAARASGVDVRLLHQLASLGGANSGALQQIMPWVLDGEMNFRFAIRNADKDLGYFRDMSGINGDVGSAMAQLLGRIVAQGQGEQFMPQLIDLLGEVNGIADAPHPKAI